MAQIFSSHPRRALTIAAPFMAGALLLGACSKSNDTTSSGNATTTAAPATTAKASTGTSGTTPKGTTAGTTKADTTIDKKVWFRGFRYDLGAVSYDSEKNEVTIATKVTNLGNDPATPDPPATLVNGGVELSRGNLVTSPTITGGKTVDDDLLFSNVPTSFTIAGTSLVITDGSQYQEVKVPLDGKGDTVTLEPVEQTEVIAPIVIGNVTLTPKKTEVRFDLPNNHQIEAEAGTAFLIISGSTTNASTTSTEYNQSGVTVTTSTGTFPAQFINGNVIPASQTTDTAFYFAIKQPVEGEWTLDLKDQPFGTDNAPLSGSSKVKVTAKKATTGTTR